jgi:IS605 OrfB family transposase
MVAVKQTVQVRLLPTSEQAEALRTTLLTCNKAASWLSEQMHSRGSFRKFTVHRSFYAELRERFGLGAQAAVRVIGKAAEAYASLHANLRAGRYGLPGSTRRLRVEARPVVFKPDAAQPFDLHCLSWLLPDEGGNGSVSIWSTAGRLRNVPMIADPRHMLLLRTRRVGEADLVHRAGKWFLKAVVEVPAPPAKEPENGFLGVDLGITNIATTSDGERMSGARLNRYRLRHLRIRRRLQAKKSSSTRRLLRKRQWKETRFAADVNHCVSKSIVAEAERTGRGIAVEDLTGIRARVRLRKPQRATLHSWAFAQLGGFLRYKAEQAGVAFVQVDPAYTSQMCHVCGRVDKRNRKSQAEFECGRCGFVGHADHNAARNIAARGGTCWGEVIRPYAAPTPVAGRGGSSNPGGNRRTTAAG